MDRRRMLQLAAGLGGAWLGARGAHAAPPAERLAPGAALNIAGRQRMLLQRMAKAYALAGMEIEPVRARELLAESLARFESQQAALGAAAPSGEERAALGRLERAWQPYRATLLAPALRRNADAVYQLSEVAQDAAHQLVLAYEKSAPAARWVNVAGRQRMLSQRMAKFWLFRAWDLHARSAESELKFARAEFSSGLYQLAQAPDNTAEIRTALAELDRVWQPYRDRLFAPLDAATRRPAAARIAAESEQVLAACETLVTLYERQLGGR